MITYICKYTPLELMEGMGLSYDSKNTEIPDFSLSDEKIHSSICSHAKQLLTVLLDPDAVSVPGAAAAQPEGCSGCDVQTGNNDKEAAVLTNCCDSIRRVYDTVILDEREKNRNIVMLDLPHNDREYSVRKYADELLLLKNRLASMYSEDSGSSENAAAPAFNRERFLAAWRHTALKWTGFNGKKKSYIAILGARAGMVLLEKLESGLPYKVYDLTCGGVRTLPAPPENAEMLPERELFERYARALLSQMSCMRMQNIENRNAFLQSEIQSGRLKGIVYHTVRFCDYYSFEYAQIRDLCAINQIPLLKLESDYTRQSEGQISTRLEAFAESLHEVPGDMQMNNNIKNANGENVDFSKAIFVGIDSGSTTTNAAAVSGDGKLLASAILRTGAHAGKAAENALKQIRDELGENAAYIQNITATGYGRDFITLADAAKTEISCHAKGAHFLYPKARTIIDIGGQDSKVICLDENGVVTNFIMNDKCAAGTGRFLEMMSHTLEIPLTEMSQLGIKWKKDLTISSVCTVFAESEVVSLIAESHETDDIIHALSKSVAAKTVSMVKRAKGEGPFMMTGGVARNASVVKELSLRLGENIYISEVPDLAGAVGAALFGSERL